MEVNEVYWLAFVAVGLASLLMNLLWRKKVRELPDISDEEFVGRFTRYYSSEFEKIAQGRRRVAHVLGISAEKLAPEYSYKELAHRFDTLGSFSVAWSDLEFEVQETSRIQSTSLETIPLTVGDLVAGLIQAERLTSAGS